MQRNRRDVAPCLSILARLFYLGHLHQAVEFSQPKSLAWSKSERFTLQTPTCGFWLASSWPKLTPALFAVLEIKYIWVLFARISLELPLSITDLGRSHSSPLVLSQIRSKCVFGLHLWVFCCCCSVRIETRKHDKLLWLPLLLMLLSCNG